MASQNTLHLKAPAKINLILRVLAKREDGYHDLSSWMQKISLHDEITVQFSESPGIFLTCSGTEVPAAKGNLIWQAAEVMLSKCENGHDTGITIHLHKNIPVAAGLGGGSSDAGTLLKGLNDCFSERLSEGELVGLAKSLGADVPFFVSESQSVLATGIGDKLLPVTPLHNCTFLLVNPGISVSTQEIFTKFALTNTDKNSTLTGFRTLEPKDLRLAALENDLEKTSIKLFPVISKIKHDLQVSGADAVLMSGSGPTVFGVFTDSKNRSEEHLNQIAARLRHDYGEQVYLTK
ncbi:MAG: 4-(cytidine 5'-diphospho)-2-C-methyl-D-erythritol kinase [Desulfocapsaceae bacterium]|nr:4-(cytidine 5'-diphospho)-2-C-methyl-D-erythritol kinase [Desulfocapsaceae bacterium]